MNKIKTTGLLLLGVVPATLMYLTDDTVKDMVESGQIEMPEAESGEKKQFIEGLISLRRLHNYGVARGLLKNRPELVRLISVILTGAVAYKLSDEAVSEIACDLPIDVSAKSVMRLSKMLGASILLGGSMSNTKDRIKRGYVVDYFSFDKGPKALKDLVFNISDMAILAGLLMYLSLGENVEK